MIHIEQMDDVFARPESGGIAHRFVNDMASLCA